MLSRSVMSARQCYANAVAVCVSAVAVDCALDAVQCNATQGCSATVNATAMQVCSGMQP